MMIVADRRRRRIDPSPDRVADLERDAAVYFQSRLRVAKGLVAMQEGGDHLELGYSNVRDYATSVLRVPGHDVRPLLDLGRSLAMRAAPAEVPEMPATVELGAERDEEADEPSSDGLFCGQPAGEHDESVAAPTVLSAAPTIEDRVRTGALSTDNASQLARLRRELGGLSDEEQARWSRLAETTRPWTFRTMVGKAIEEAKQGKPTKRFEAFVTESALADFRRAKDVASRRAKRRLSDGQVFALLVRRFVEAEDTRYVGEKKRRVPHTKLLPGDRFVPAATRRAIEQRGEESCEVGDCSNHMFLELMHIRTPHAEGGAREVEDLAAGCSTHHVLLDAGVIRFVGYDEWQRPVFRTRGGRLLRRSPPSWAPDGGPAPSGPPDP
jgi:hypothetical protein